MFLIVVILSIISFCYSSVENSIHLSQLQTLVLRKGQYTQARRTAPIKQINCLNCRDYSPDTIMCTNLGYDGNTYNWKCEADMPENYNFDQSSIEVSCEGYDHSGDDNVLVGSCGVFFSIKESPIREKVKTTYKERENIQEPRTTTTYVYNDEDSDGEGIGFFGFMVIVIIIAILICVCCCCCNKSQPGVRTNSHSSASAAIPRTRVYPSAPTTTTTTTTTGGGMPTHSTHHTTHHHHNHHNRMGGGFGSGFSTGLHVGNAMRRRDPVVVHHHTTSAPTKRSTSSTTKKVTVTKSSKPKTTKRTAYGGTRTR